MIASLYWDITRASANIALIIMLLTILWGVLLATRVLKPNDRPAWLRDLHTWLGGLTIVFTVIHMITLVLDKYVNFSWVDILVPFTSEWKPVPVTLGVLSFYLLVGIQLTSVMMKKLSRATWRKIHMLSYLLYAIAVVHAITAGTDTGKPLFTGFTVALAMVGATVAGLRLVAGRSTNRRARQQGATTQ
jgi:DMSO/TMAO reductase YedYZ heme-binding membrane subunit